MPHTSLLMNHGSLPIPGKLSRRNWPQRLGVCDMQQINLRQPTAVSISLGELASQIIDQRGAGSRWDKIAP
jgi:hypothetical protein